MSPQSRRERKKAGKDRPSGSNSNKATPLSNNDAVKRKLKDAGLLDKEKMEPESKPIGDLTNGEGKIFLVEATAVYGNEGEKPVESEVSLTTGAQEPQPVAMEPEDSSQAPQNEDKQTGPNEKTFWYPVEWAHQCPIQCPIQ